MAIELTVQQILSLSDPTLLKQKLESLQQSQSQLQTQIDFEKKVAGQTESRVSSGEEEKKRLEIEWKAGEKKGKDDVMTNLLSSAAADLRAAEKQAATVQNKLAKELETLTSKKNALSTQLQDLEKGKDARLEKMQAEREEIKAKKSGLEKEYATKSEEFKSTASSQKKQLEEEVSKYKQELNVECSSDNIDTEDILGVEGGLNDKLEASEEQVTELEKEVKAVEVELEGVTKKRDQDKEELGRRLKKNQDDANFLQKELQRVNAESTSKIQQIKELGLESILNELQSSKREHDDWLRRKELESQLSEKDLSHIDSTLEKTQKEHQQVQEQALNCKEKLEKEIKETKNETKKVLEECEKMERERMEWEDKIWSLNADYTSHKEGVMLRAQNDASQKAKPAATQSQSQGQEGGAAATASGSSSKKKNKNKKKGESDGAEQPGSKTEEQAQSEAPLLTADDRKQILEDEKKLKELQVQLEKEKQLAKTANIKIESLEKDLKNEKSKQKKQQGGRGGKGGNNSGGSGNSGGNQGGNQNLSNQAGSSSPFSPSREDRQMANITAQYLNDDTADKTVSKWTETERYLKRRYGISITWKTVGVVCMIMAIIAAGMARN